MRTELNFDALIAEKVMGWKRERDYGWVDPKGSFRLSDEIPHYSTNIADAWQVVEKMAELGYWCQMRNEFESHARPDCWAGFTPHSTTGWNGTPDHWTQADTMPLAICIAALATLEEKR